MSLVGCAAGPHEGTQHALGKPLHDGPCSPPAPTPAQVTDEAAIRERIAALQGEAARLAELVERPTRLYVCGPMTGLPEWNFPAFRAAAARLREAGFDVVDPSVGDEPQGTTDHRSWAERIKVAIGKLVTCDGVAVLPGWPGSKGARLEVQVARGCEMPVGWVDSWLEEARKQA